MQQHEQAASLSSPASLLSVGLSVVLPPARDHLSFAGRVLSCPARLLLFTDAADQNVTRWNKPTRIKDAPFPALPAFWYKQLTEG